ncbi:LAFA_0G23662g1_1 [Lachancea sp. 'fantastica']|nr:LAFA_0G23662g1_1 [Lachancea sp. 'fantastica']
MAVSESMKASETPVVYAVTFGEMPHYTLATSQSQGFAWNQDIFASQYQQMCKVVYDGHEDCVDQLLAFSGSESGYEVQQHLSAGSGVFEEDDEQDRTTHEDPRVRRVSHVLMRPRRRSERSVSFVSDSKNGRFHRTEVIAIDVEEDTEENRELKRLLRDRWL